MVASILVLLTLQPRCLPGQELIVLEGQKSVVSMKMLRSQPSIDSDWFPVLLTIDNKLQNSSGIFDIQMGTHSTEDIDPLYWRTRLEVPAGQVTRKLVGLPMSWNWYNSWQHNQNFEVSVSRDGQALSVAGRDQEFSGRSWITSRKPSETNQGYALVLLEVTSAAHQSSESFDWRDIQRSGNERFNANNLIIGAEELPQNREALLGVDMVLLQGIDPEDLAIGQRKALRGAVEAGLVVLLRPDEKGRGLRWLPGSSVEPVVYFDSDGKERVRFPVTGARVKKLTTDCDSVAQGLGRWLVLERPNGPWELPSAAGLRHPWHLGSARARLESGYPLKQFLESIDLTQRAGNPLRLILILGLCYVCVLWPVIGTILKNRGKLPHMLWLQPVVGASCILLVFIISTFRLGILPRMETEALLVRFPGQDHGVIYLIDSSYAPTGGRKDFPATSTLPVLPLAVGASTQNHTLTLAKDGTTQVSSNRKIRTTSHHVRCDVVQVPPSVREVMMNEGIFTSDPGETFRQLLASEPGTKASLVSFGFRDAMPEGATRHISSRSPSWSRGDEATIQCRGLERSKIGAFFDEEQVSKLGIDPEVMLTIFDAALVTSDGDIR